MTLAGLAADGGLYVPEAWPRLSAGAIAELAGASYVDTAVAVMRPFVAGTLDDAALRALCEEAYGRFDHAAVTPLIQLDARHWLLELFHGPTLAFKDVALQLLGLLFERFVGGRALTIIGATSGDTGSAAINAVAGRAGIELFMMHPAGRISDVQRRQMTTVLAPNIHNLAVEGDFDDCQRLAKALLNDPALSAQLTLSAVNSINWARLLAQIVYYFYAAARLAPDGRPVAFAVPTGNFGDVFAGYVAHRMGLPIARLIVATNVNDILARALTNGDYSSRGVERTATPSMDIQVSSNFERLLFDLAGRDAATVAATMRAFEADKALQLPSPWLAEAQTVFSARRVDADAMAQAMRWALERGNRLIDPHTAIGLAAARTAELPADVPVVTLATAHPAKFGAAVERATGVRPTLPPRLAGLFDREERCTPIAASVDAVRAYVLAHVPA